MNFSVSGGVFSPMNLKPLRAAFCAGGLMLTAPLAQAHDPGRETIRAITFRPGQTNARVHFFLRGPLDGAQLLVRARAGQHLRVRVVRGGPLVIDVSFPSGRRAGDKGTDFALTAGETGLYRVSLGENQMAEGGPGSFVVDVLRR